MTNSTGLIPDQLLRDVKQRERVPFLGADVRTPGVGQLAHRVDGVPQLRLGRDVDG